MAAVGIRQLKNQTSEILRRVEDGEEIVVTRRGRPCARLIPAPGSVSPPPAFSTLAGIFRERLPPASWGDFEEAKQIWNPKPLPEE